MRCSTLTRMSGNGSGGENGRILTHDFPKTVQTLPCMSHTASMGLGASGMWSSRDCVLAARNRQGGAGEEHKTLNDLKNHGCPVWPIYPPGCQRARLEQDLTYCQNALLNRSLQTTKRRLATFFLINGCLKKRYREKKKRREMCCNKEAVNGACFWIFYSVHLCGKKKNLILQCDACAVPSRWSCWR